jgi:hypothetical protein
MARVARAGTGGDKAQQEHEEEDLARLGFVRYSRMLDGSFGKS